MAGYYWVDVSDDWNTTRSDPFFALYAPKATGVHVLGGGGYKIEKVPTIKSPVVEVVTRYTAAYALTKEGTIVAWGDVTKTDSVRDKLKDVVALAAGDKHVVALRANGTVAVFGNTERFEKIPAAATGIVAVAAGDMRCYALRKDGRVITWGVPKYKPTSIPSAAKKDVIGLSATGRSVLALKANGKVVGWDQKGTLSIPKSLPKATRVFALSGCMAVLNSKGAITAWGDYAGELQDAIQAGPGFFSISRYNGGGVALKNDGSLYASGHLSFPASELTKYNSVTVAKAASQHVILVRDKSGDKAPKIKTQPVSVTAMETGSATFAVVATAGTAPLNYQWYKGSTKIKGATDSTFHLTDLTSKDAAKYSVKVSNHLGSVTSAAAPLQIVALPTASLSSSERRLINPTQSFKLTATVKGTGTLSYQWYRNGLPIPNATSSSYTVPAGAVDLTATYWLRVTSKSGQLTGSNTSAAVFLVADRATKVVTWGGSAFSMPAGLENPVAISANDDVAAAVQANGKLVVWNRKGNALSLWHGDPTFDAVDVAVGRYSVFVLRANGTVRHYAINGDSLRQNDLSDLGTASGVGAIAAPTYALKRDGSVISWGMFEDPEETITSWRDIAALAEGSGYTLLLKRDGSVATEGWGSPEMPAGLGSVIGVAAGDGVSLVLKQNRTIAAWATYPEHPALAVPDGLTEVVSVGAGARHALALRQDGAVVAWGANESGQADVPIDLPRVYRVAASESRSFVICEKAE